MPPGIEQIAINTKTGEAAALEDTDKRTELFINGTGPNRVADTLTDEPTPDELPSPSPYIEQPLEEAPIPTVTPTPTPRRAPSLPDSSLEGTITLDIDPATGLLAVESCPVIRTKTFVLGTEPRKYCGPDYHKRRTIEPAGPGRPRVVATPQR